MNNKPRLHSGALGVLVYGILSVKPLLTHAGVLIDMDATSRPDGRVELRLAFDGPAPNIKGYSIEQPPRVSIDLPATTSGLPKYNELGFDVAQSVTVLEAGKRTRLVVNQKIPTGFSSKVDGNLLYIALGDNSKPAAAPVNSMPPQEMYTPGIGAAYGLSPSVEKSVAGSVTEIDFHRGDAGEGNLVVSLSSSGIPVDINEVSGRIRLQFQGDIIPEKLQNRLDVIDFATPVKYIDAKVESGNAIIVIEPKAGYDYLVYQADNKLTVSVKPLTGKSLAKKRKGLTYKGEKLSLNFQNIEVRAVLQLIADFTSLNLVASDTVTGNVTLRLQNVPWDQALDIVLKAKGLDKRLEGNVLTVAPADEIAARERQLLENEKQIRELAPVYTDLIPINYADAAEIAAVLAGSGEEGETLLTEQGSVQVVERTNSLLIKDTQAKLDELRELLEQLDIPVRQVLIEARVVTLSTSYRKELGVKWTGGVSNSSNNRYILGGGRGTNIKFEEGTAIYDANNNFDMSALKTGFTGENIFTDLGVTADTAAALGIGFATNGTLLNLELSALLSDGGGEVISQPKVITADKQTATIKAGKQIPYTEASSSGAATVSFQDAVLSLEVTPQITPEGRVIMDIKITNDDSTETAPNGVPIIDKNEITTQVLVDDGETVVLGGVFKQTKSNRVDKVPVLGDIPYVGNLFRRKANRDEKSELMVFITPRVVSEDVNLP